MAGISRYEKVVAGMTAAFLLVTGSWFMAKGQSSQPFEVSTAHNVQSEPDRPQAELPQQTERPDSMLEGETIDINTADAYELQRLPGVGEKRAQAIVAYREANGPFQTLEELTQVEGIGEGILSGLRDYASLG